MNRLQYWLTAKTSYNIQSPFLFELYDEVLSARLDATARQAAGLADGDRYGELLYMLANHYDAAPCTNPFAIPQTLHCSFLQRQDGSHIGVVNSPHRNRETEKGWKSLLTHSPATLSVDLFNIGIFFTSPKLSRQHFLLR